VQKTSLKDLLASFDPETPDENREDLLQTLELLRPEHLTLDEGEAAIASHVESFVIGTREFAVDFEHPDECGVAVLLHALAKVLGTDRFTMTSALLDIVERYFGYERISSFASPKSRVGPVWMLVHCADTEIALIRKQ